MKQIRKLKLILIVTLAVASFITPVLWGGRSIVSAAGCITNPSSDTLVTNQQECVKKYVKDCVAKKFDKDFCEDLSVQQINKCAADKGFTLKKACLDNLKADETNEAGSSSERCGDDCTNIGQEYKEGDCDVGQPEGLTSDNCEIIKTIILITNVLSGIAATVIVAMIIVGGIQYSMAGAEAAKVQAAKQKITNALLALLLLVFGFSIIQWLVPGGLI